MINYNVLMFFFNRHYYSNVIRKMQIEFSEIPAQSSHGNGDE